MLNAIGTADEYKANIVSYAKPSISQALYSGAHYQKLASFLDPQHEAYLTSRSVHDTDAGLKYPGVLYKIYQNSPPSKVYLETSEAIDSTDVCVDPNVSHNSLLFLCGYLSPTWISHVGAKYDIDPEFWNRHASFLDADLPVSGIGSLGLPSQSNRVVQLPFMSTGAHELSEGLVNQNLIDHAREESASEMLGYLHRLRTGRLWEDGASITRDMLVLDEHHFSIEQIGTIHVNEKPEGTWAGTSFLTPFLDRNRVNVSSAVIWLDTGADLAKSPAGPWLGAKVASEQGVTLSLDRYFLPVAQRKSRVVPETHTTSSGDRAANSGSVKPLSLPQSCLLLPSTYTTTLSFSKMYSSPFYALSGLFEFMAAAELQFLEIIAAKIEKSLQKASELQLNDTISPQVNLVFYRRTLEKRIQEIAKVMAVCTNHSDLDWPTSPDAASEADSTARSLERDLKYILDLAVQLRSQCDREMFVMMNAASIAEVKRGVEQGRTLFKFTLLASVFVPLSFTCTLFGMNVSEFGQGGKPRLWAWAMVTILTFCVSFLFLFWNQPAMKSSWAFIKRLFIW